MPASRRGRWRRRSRSASRRCRTGRLGPSFARPLASYGPTGGHFSQTPRLSGLAVTPDQAVRRTVVLELRLLGRLELGNDRLGQHLAELDPPLIERVDPPDRSLSEDGMLVERDQ